MAMKTLLERQGTKAAGALLLCLSLVGLNSAEYSGPKGTNTVSGSTELARAFADLNKGWRSGKITSVLIAHVFSHAEYRLEYTPKRLDEEATFRLLVRAPQEQAVTRALMEQLTNVNTRLSSEECWVRWGFVFFTADGERAFSLYIDQTGQKGVMNDQYVSFTSTGLFEWAESTFGTVFKGS